eukprot:scaffold1205_cov249-Pinguiococcus_pyrenoidosus.AAC.6
MEACPCDSARRRMRGRHEDLRALNFALVPARGRQEWAMGRWFVYSAAGCPRCSMQLLGNQWHLDYVNGVRLSDGAYSHGAVL